MLKRKKSRPMGEIPLASMADIAFLLLVFFLTSTVFDEDKGLSLVLPPAGEQVGVSASNVIFFMIGPDGLVDVKRGESPQIQRVARNQVGPIWRTEAGRNPLLIAAVKTAPGAPYRFMIDVLDELQSSGAERVSLQELTP